ncbi:hypothetical protein Tco_0980548 [Tanacetum coccineum]
MDISIIQETFYGPLVHSLTPDSNVTPKISQDTNPIRAHSQVRHYLSCRRCDTSLLGPTSEPVTSTHQAEGSGDNVNDSPSLQGQILDQIDDMGGEEEKAVDDNAGGPGDEDMQKPFKEVLRRCFKDPTEFSKIIRRANEILPDFKERWTDEMSYIHDVPKVRQWKSGLSIALTISAPPSTMMKFIVIRAASPYNIILGRTGMKKLRVIPSIIHVIMKFPTPRGIATLVTQKTTIFKCRKLKEKQMLEEEKAMEKMREKRRGSLVE